MEQMAQNTVTSADGCCLGPGDYARVGGGGGYLTTL
jgi:hypothetical protein